MSYAQLTEKYGETTGGRDNLRVFNGGFGRYFWSEEGQTGEFDMKSAVGAIVI